MKTIDTLEHIRIELLKAQNTCAELHDEAESLESTLKAFSKRALETYGIIEDLLMGFAVAEDTEEKP